MGWFGENIDELIDRYLQGVKMIMDENDRVYQNVLDRWHEEVKDDVMFRKYDPNTSKILPDLEPDGLFRMRIFAIEIGMIQFQKQNNEKENLDKFKEECILQGIQPDPRGIFDPLVSHERATELMNIEDYSSNINKALMERDLPALADYYFMALAPSLGENLTKSKHNMDLYLPTAMATVEAMCNALKQDWT